MCVEVPVGDDGIDLEGCQVPPTNPRDVRVEAASMRDKVVSTLQTRAHGVQYIVDSETPVFEFCVDEVLFHKVCGVHFCACFTTVVSQIFQVKKYVPIACG